MSEFLIGSFMPHEGHLAIVYVHLKKGGVWLRIPVLVFVLEAKNFKTTLSFENLPLDST